jgi:hypothetical protein
MFNKITETDLAGKGVIGLPDTPGLSAADMQAKFEETARSVIIPRFNALIDDIVAATASTMVGAQDPETAAKTTVQAVLVALHTAIGERAKSAEVYSKTQTDERITQAVNEKVSAIGAGDMAMAVYDPTGQKKDIFAGLDGKAPLVHMQAANSVTGGTFPDVVAATEAASNRRRLVNVEVVRPDGTPVSCKYLIAEVEA